MGELKSSVKGKLSGSLKIKLVSGFIAIGVLTGMVSIVSSFILGASINKLDKMVETTVLANGIINKLNELTDVQGALTQYVTLKDEESLNKINDNKRDVLNNVAALKSLIADKTVLAKLVEAEQQINTCSELIDSAVKAAEGQDAIKAAQDKDEAIKIIGFIKIAVDEFIASELNYQEIKKSELKKQAAFTNLMLIVIIIAVTSVSIFIAAFYTGRIASTINKLAHNAQTISEGNLQVSEITVRSNDDISLLASAFNKMGESLRTLISSINKSSEEVASSAEMLKLGVDQSTHTIQVIASTIEQVSSGAHNQSEQSKETAEVIEQLLEGNKRVYENVQNVLLTSGEAMSAAQNGNEKLKLLLNQIQVIEEKIVSTQSITELLNRRTGEIKLILDTISNISSQTNLLALNAAIEAARAGEHGKGFAVVADEIRKLAVGSADAANEITDMLQEIQLRSMQAADSMGLGVSEVKSGIEIANNASEAFEKIVNTSENVDLKVKHINREIENIVKDIKRVKDMSDSISGIANQFSNGSQEVAAAVEEQMAGLEEISTSASVLTEMASGLEDMVSRFKL